MENYKSVREEVVTCNARTDSDPMKGVKGVPLPSQKGEVAIEDGLHSGDSAVVERFTHPLQTEAC